MKSCRCLVSLCLLFVISLISFQLEAKLNFSSRNDSIVLKLSDSRLKLSSVNSLKGWKEMSIVLESGDDHSWVLDNAIYGFESGDTEPPNHLIYNDSNAIVNNSWAIESNHEDIVENSNAIVNNSWAIQALMDDVNESSNAIVTIDELVKENSNAILNTGGSNELAEQNSNAIIENNKHFISINDGKLYAVGSIIGETFINGRGILSSPIDLNGATLTNGGDLLFSSQTTVSSSGYLSPQGCAYILGGDLLLPDDVILTFTSSGIIDGQGHSLVFGNNAQILIDSNVTVTLKNLIVKNDEGAINSFAIQPIKCLDWYSKLALDNVKFALNNDFIYPMGQIYFHNDVRITGTSKFSYRSVLPSYIQPHSNLYFDSQTIFDYYPSLTRNDLIVMADKTSSIYLNGATLQTTDTGIKLTKGQVYFDNKVTLSTKCKYSLTNLTQKDTKDFGTRAYSVAWSPNGNYLAVGGENSSEDIIIYEWNGSTLTQKDTKDFGTRAYSVAWSPNGNYLAVGGINGSEDIIVYEWNGSTLTQKDTKDFGIRAYSLAWSPNGNYLAVGGNNGSEDIVVYEWNGSTLTQKDTKDLSSYAYFVAWSPNGNYLAAGGINGSEDLIIYEWNGSTLTQKDTKDFGTRAYSAAWSSNGNYLAVGGENGSEDIIVYEWNGSTLTQKDTKDFGTLVYSVAWSPNGNYLVAGGYNGSEDVIVYEWNGSTLIQKDAKDLGSSAYSVAWNPNGNYLTVGGSNGSEDIMVYRVNYTFIKNNPTFHNSIIFGDSKKGSDYNLDINILSGAQIIVDGTTWYDPTNSSGKLDFANMGASIVLSDTNSKFKITNSENVSGWKEQSIVTYSGNDNSWISDNTIYGYSLTDTNPPTHLIFNNSNAIVNNSWAIESNHEDIVENSNAIVDLHEDIVENSNALITCCNNANELIQQNSMAIVLNREILDIHDNSIEQNSEAIISNAINISNLQEDVTENSSALITCCTNANELIAQNSNAIIENNKHFISINDGKLYAVGSITGETFINGRGILSSPIDLNGATLTNGGDLLFSSQTTVSSSGYLSPQGHAYILGGDLSLPDDVILTFTSSGIIDGQGHSLVFGNNAQILVDSNVTVTLKNLTVKNDEGAINSFAIQPIKCLDWYSKLALDNVTFALNNDFIYPMGQMYFHNDVRITGTSKFSYRSVLPSYIQPHSNLYFDSQTTFDYYPSSIRNDLIVLNDETSFLHLNGATLQTTGTGIKLTRGNLLCDNKVTLSNAYVHPFTDLTNTTSKYFGAEVHSVAWSLDGSYLAVGGVNGTTNLIIYEWNGSTLTQKDTQDFGAEVRSVAWSPDGNYLAVAGVNGSDDVIVYEWNGSTLTQKDTKDFGNYAQFVSWSPDGSYLAVGGRNGLTDLIIYEWNGSTLTQKDTKAFGTRVVSVAWSFDGNFLAVGGDNAPNALIIYEWDGSTLTQKDTKAFGNYALSVSWNPDGSYLAVGGSNLSTDLIIYEWNGSILTQKDTKDFGVSVGSVSWSLDGKYLAVGGNNGTTDLIIYEWNGSTLTQKETQDFGNWVRSVAWSSDGNYLAVGGDNGTTDLIVYRANCSFVRNNLAFHSSIIFGDSEKGSDYDIDINILSGAQVIFDGTSWFDNSITSSRKMNFANMGASVVLNDAESKFKVTNSENVSGWKEQSIVNYSGNDNSWILDNTIYGYSLTDTNPPTHLIFNNSNAIVNNSWAIESNHEDIVENSNAIVDLHEDIVENSNALITCCANANELIQQNSMAIVTNDNDINYNSQAIVTIDNDMDIVKLIAQNSAAIIGNSNTLVTLDREVIENSNAIVNNSWAIADLNNQIHENSWAIQNLIEHGEAIELVAQNSNAIFSTSQSIVTLDRQIVENSNAIIQSSNAIVTLNNYIEQNSNFIEDNSWAILSLQDDIFENSYAIVNNDEDISYNSAAIITCCNNVNDLITQNSNAIVNLEEDIIENSNAIVNSESELAVENSNAIVNLEEDIHENSQAIVTNHGDIINNSNSIITIESDDCELAKQNSNAIVNLEPELMIENSNAIIHIGSISTDLIIENSNAIVNNSNSIAQELIIENSNAIVTITQDYLFSDPIVTDVEIERSLFVQPNKRIFIDGDVTIDGKCAVLYFATSGESCVPQFVIAEGRTVVLKNISLTGLRSSTFDFRKNSTLIIGENVSWELHEDVSFATGKIVLQNQISNGIDIANLFYIHGMNGKKRLTLSPKSDTQLPILNVGQNTLALQNIEFTGLEYVGHSISSDGLLIGAVGLAGETAVNIEKSNNLAFAVAGLGNVFRILENNLTFNGQLDFVGLGEDVVHFDFVLRSPVESLSAATQLADGKVPVINFATNFIYLTSLNGIARILFDDAIVRINNSSNAFIATNNGYLAANTLLVSGDPIWDESNGTAKNRFAVEAQEIVAVKAIGSGYERVLPEFGIPIIVDPYHLCRALDIDLVRTMGEILDVRQKNALQTELEK